ncbi:hypothetical protein C7B76_20670 [filamentous cyanobacterium CCP2]|nr:hypothetical protein C7B76_20670 [filamentous cyanobacterium CCP2]
MNSSIATWRLSRSTLPLLGITLGIWAIDAITVCQVAQAYSTEQIVSVQWDADETYEGLTRRAEMAARTAAQQSFDRDILITTVDILVLGENGSSVVPILRLKVDRNDWRNRPDPQLWAIYYGSSRSLLELGGMQE